MIRITNDSEIPRLPIKKAKETIENVFAGENNPDYIVDVIYVDSEYMTELNNKYLGHEGDTDVITFPLSDEGENTIEGEIYICPKVAKEQAAEYNVTTNNELIRLAAHGALHLCGYDDDTDEKRLIMHNLETKYMADKFSEE